MIQFLRTRNWGFILGVFVFNTAAWAALIWAMA